MAVVTVKAVECQMLRVTPILHGVEFVGLCRCGVRVIAETRDSAIAGLNEHRFAEGRIGPEAFSVEIEKPWRS